jgi:hypothetical protein
MKTFLFPLSVASTLLFAGIVSASGGNYIATGDVVIYSSVEKTQYFSQGIEQQPAGGGEPAGGGDASAINVPYRSSSSETVRGFRVYDLKNGYGAVVRLFRQRDEGGTLRNYYSVIYPDNSSIRPRPSEAFPFVVMPGTRPGSKVWLAQNSASTSFQQDNGFYYADSASKKGVSMRLIGAASPVAVSSERSLTIPKRIQGDSLTAEHRLYQVRPDDGYGEPNQGVGFGRSKTKTDMRLDLKRTRQINSMENPQDRTLGKAMQILIEDLQSRGYLSADPI